MVPQLGQGFLQPGTRSGTGKEQRWHNRGSDARTGGSAGASGEARGRFRGELPADSVSAVDSGEEGIRKALDADRGIGAVPAMHERRIGK